MQNKSMDLCLYRFSTALETLETAKTCIDIKHYKDAINRSYYASFYAIKAVLAMEGIDFKRHKDVVAYFNKNYVATESLRKLWEENLRHFNRQEKQAIMMIFT